MLRYIILFLSLLLPWAVFCQAGKSATVHTYSGQPIEGKINLLSPVTGGIGLGIETPVAGKVNLALNGEYGLQKINMWEGIGGHYSSLKAVLEGRFYPFRKEVQGPADYFNGPYTSFWVRYQNTEVAGSLPEGEFDLLRGETYAAGLMVGWQFNLLHKYPGFLVDIAAGAGYQTASMTGRMNPTGRSILFNHEGFVPRVNLSFGLSLGGVRATEGVSSGTTKSRVAATAKKKPGEAERSRKDSTPAKYEQEIRYYSRYERAQLKAIEQALRKMHFDPGKADGKIDEKTIRAVIRFQRSHRLAADGKAGPKTLRLLGLEE